MASRLPVKLLLLVAAVLLCAAAAVAAAPAVTSVACSGGVSSWCSAGAKVTLTGTGLPTSGSTTVAVGVTTTQQSALTCTNVTVTSATTLSCTLAVASGYTGSYPVVLTNTDTSSVVTKTYVGDLLVGAFYEQTTSALALWSSPPLTGVIDVSEVVTGIDGNGIINTGKSFTIYGNFTSTSTYKLYLYNTQSDMVTNSPGLPTCSNADALTVKTTGLAGALPNTLVCTSLTTVTKAMGMYGYLVYNTVTKRYVYGAGSLYYISVNPPNPTVSSVTATCSNSSTSTSCSSGVSLTLKGTNMNLRTPTDSKWNHFVNFTVDANPNGLQPSAAITCVTTAVDATANTATLSLTISSDVLPGAYPLYVVNQVCNDGMKAPSVWVGNVIVGLARTVSTSAPWQTLATATNNSYIAGAAPYKVITKEQFAVYGNFNATAASRYEVHFVDGSSQALQSSSSTPTCTSVTVSSTALRCTYTAKSKSATSSLAPMVYDTTTKAYLQNALLLSNGYASITFESSKYDDDEHGPGDNPAAIAFAVIFAVLFLGMFITLIVICCCCKVINKKKFMAAGGLGGGGAPAELQSYTNGQYDVDRENMNVNVVDFSTTGSANNGVMPNAYGAKDVSGVPPTARTGPEPTRNP